MHSIYYLLILFIGFLLRTLFIYKNKKSSTMRVFCILWIFVCVSFYWIFLVQKRKKPMKRNNYVQFFYHPKFSFMKWSAMCLKQWTCTINKHKASKHIHIYLYIMAKIYLHTVNMCMIIDKIYTYYTWLVYREILCVVAKRNKFYLEIYEHF